MSRLTNISLILTLLLTLSVGADQEFVFQYGLDDCEDTKDTHITQYSGNNMNNMGGNLENECCEYNPANIDAKSILIWFDVSSVPKGAIVGEARLELNMTGTRNGTTAKDVCAFRLLRDWGEGTGTGIDGRAAKDGEVCGQAAHWPDDKWDTLCADGGSVDRVEEPDDTIEVGAELGDWYVWDISKMCQYWVEHPDENFGIILQEPPDEHSKATGTKVFASKENPNEEVRPRLVVVVTAMAVDSKSKIATHWGNIKKF
jgi:hypothetical protein